MPADAGRARAPAPATHEIEHAPALSHGEPLHVMPGQHRQFGGREQLDHGHAPLALLLLSAFVACAGAVNLTAPSALIDTPSPR